MYIYRIMDSSIDYNDHDPWPYWYTIKTIVADTEEEAMNSLVAFLKANTSKFDWHKRYFTKEKGYLMWNKEYRVQLVYEGENPNNAQLEHLINYGYRRVNNE